MGNGKTKEKDNVFWAMQRLGYHAEKIDDSGNVAYFKHPDDNLYIIVFKTGTELFQAPENYDDMIDIAIVYQCYGDRPIFQIRMTLGQFIKSQQEEYPFAGF